jgi:uncharacterized protein with GYD domain
MPGWVTFVKWTDRGRDTVKDGPKRIKAGKELAQRYGIAPVGVWALMGEYDIIFIGDAPNDEAMAAFSLAISAQGNGTTHTMRALSEDEFQSVLQKLP